MSAVWTGWLRVEVRRANALLLGVLWSRLREDPSQIEYFYVKTPVRGAGQIGWGFGATPVRAG